MQQQMLMQRQALMQQSLYHPGFPAPPQIEPISSGNLPPRFDSSTCCCVYIGNIHPSVTEPLLQNLFTIIGLVKGCKLIKKERSSYGFVDYSHHRSAAIAIEVLNGQLLCGQPIKVNWAYANAQREDTSSHFSIFVGDLSPEVTDAALYACFSVYPTCSDARVMWDQKNDRSMGYGFVYFRSQQDAQSSINDFNGKWLGSGQIRCNWARNGADGAAQLMYDPMNVVELTNATSDDSQEKRNEDAPENNLQYTTVYVGNLAPEVTDADLHRHFHALYAGVIVEVRIQRYKGFGFVRYRSHAEAAHAIQMGQGLFLFGKRITCSWGTKPTPPGTSTRPLAPPPPAHVHGFTAADQAAYEWQLALRRVLTSPQGQRQAAATQPLAGYPGMPTPTGTSTRPLAPPTLALAPAHVHGFTAADQAAYERHLALSRALTSPQGQRQAAATQPLAGYPGMPTPPGTSTRPQAPPAPAPAPAPARVHGFIAADQAAYERQLALSRALTSPQGQRQAAATQPLAGYPGMPAARPPRNYQYF